MSPFSKFFTLAIFCLVGSVCAQSNAVEKDFEAKIKPLLRSHCIRCHGEKKQEGDLRIDQLDPDLVKGQSADFWHEVLNQINEGRMPPEGERQLSTKQLNTITAWLEIELKKAAAHRNSTGGRQLMRRMSRYEFQYTLQDLLGIALDYSDRVPTDLTGEDGLQTNARRLGMSQIQLASYLEVVQLALDEAIPDGPEKVHKGEVKSPRPANVRKQPRHKGFKGKARFIAPSPGLTKSNFIHDLPRKATFDERPFAGRFRIRVRCIATASSDGRLPELMVQVGHRASGDYDPKKIMGRKILKASDKEQIVDFIGNIEDFPLGKKDGYYNGSGSHNVTHLSAYIWNTTQAKSKITKKSQLDEIDEPLIEVKAVEFEGPLLEGYPSQIAKDLLPEFEADADEATMARTALERFIPRAYRRQVTDEEISHAVKTFNDFREFTGDFKAAMRSTMAMLLISPKFIYLVEPSPDDSRARKLNSFELATRLSYFLWGSMPDDELRALATSGELLNPDVLKAQVTRMRNDARFKRFVKHFSAQWLGLDAMDHVAVNPKVHPNFSDDIRENLRAETLAFGEHVFVNDLSCRNFIQSDFAMLNQVVAQHYGIPDVYGHEFRPVSLKPNEHRGGVLTQGSFSIIGSDGTDSNPIYRGVWLRKRLFADPPPPPPPGAPPLNKEDPDLSRLSLKQQIEAHRKAATCARCHNQIDPWGVAFENYDATGRWRTQQAQVMFDATSKLPDGEVVAGMAGLKKYLLEKRSSTLAEALTRRMSAYALGRELEFSDIEMVKTLASRFEKSGFKASHLIEGIVTSDAFLTK
ncbi:MAG: hypothetical protein CMJ78_03220 [Planctomycetaceae bacterium]|nr:hypothetical protein [Planctomycetaceae bacterium]